LIYEIIKHLLFIDSCTPLSSNNQGLQKFGHIETRNMQMNVVA